MKGVRGVCCENSLLVSTPARGLSMRRLALYRSRAAAGLLLSDSVRGRRAHRCTARVRADTTRLNKKDGHMPVFF
nr:MAG TPA: hypothetical protein [Caudoviricetes sp.]